MGIHETNAQPSHSQDIEDESPGSGVPDQPQAEGSGRDRGRGRGRAKLLMPLAEPRRSARISAIRSARQMDAQRLRSMPLVRRGHTVCVLRKPKTPQVTFEFKDVKSAYEPWLLPRLTARGG